MSNLDSFQYDPALIVARAELAFNEPIWLEALAAEDQAARAEASWQTQDRERNQ